MDPLNRLFGLMILASFGFVGASSSVQCANIPVLFKAPDFVLTDHRGGMFDSKSKSSGKVSLVDFIYTSCTKECPLMTQKKRSLDRATGLLQNLQFISITTDPKRDSSTKLLEYARKYKLENDERWLFLTGSKKDITQIGQAGFKLPTSVDSIEHSQRFVLIDKSGMIRGYYDSSSSDDMKRLEDHIKTLAL